MKYKNGYKNTVVHDFNGHEVYGIHGLTNKTATTELSIKHIHVIPECIAALAEIFATTIFGNWAFK